MYGEGSVGCICGNKGKRQGIHSFWALDETKGTEISMSRLTEKTVAYQDYKYVMQDTGNIYLGAKFTYEEIMDREDVSFKMKAVMEHYVLKDIAVGTSLESHFFYMKPKEFAARTYEQLKVKVKVSELKTGKRAEEKRKATYTDKVYKICDFLELSEEEKRQKGMMIQEISISKLALMTFSV